MIKQTSNNYQNLLAYLFLLIVGCILLYPVIFSRESSFCINPDNLHQAYPFFNKLASSLHKGYLPVWDANTYGGKNFSGEIQTGIFYPINVLWCLLFGTASGIELYYLDLLISLHFLICLIGMFRLGKALGFTLPAAVASALIYTFTGVVSARAGGQTCIFFGLTLLPWAIYFISKYYLEKRLKRYMIFAGLVAGMEILSGHIQPFFHTILIGAILILFYEYRDRKDWKTFLVNVSTNLIIIILFTIIIALPQLYYAMEYLSRCYRWVGGESPVPPGGKIPLHIYAYKYIINLSELPNLLGKNYTQPDDGNLIYMGILPLFLVILYLIRNKSIKIIKEHVYLTRVLLFILIFGIISVLGYLTFFFIILYKIPFVNAVRQLGRYVILISFSASLLTGLALTHVSSLKEQLFPKPSAVKFYLLLALSVNALYLVIIQKEYIPLNVSIPFLLAFLFLFALLVAKRVSYLPFLAIAVISADLFLNRVSYQSTDTAFYPPKYYGRNKIINFLETTYGKYRVTFDMKNDDLLRRNIGDIYKIQTKLGYGATMNEAYFNFISAGWDMNSEANDLLNIKYIITDKTLDSTYTFKDSTDELKLYERKNYYPRTYWKSQLGKQGQTIESENTETIKQLAYSDPYIKIEVNCPMSDTLILSENDYPGWECYDNGKKTKIYPASIKNLPRLFRSVAVDKGHHILEFKYNKVFYWF